MDLGIKQQQYGDHYPLVNPPAGIQFVVLDMTVSMDCPEAELPLRIAYLSEEHICLRDAADRVVFDSRKLTFSAEPLGSYTTFTAYHRELQRAWAGRRTGLEYNFTTTLWGGRYRIRTWSCKTVQIRLIVAAEETGTYLLDDVWLDVRAVYKYPKHVQSINGVSCGDLRLREGHNVDVSADANSITISTAPGAGMGAYDSECDETTRDLKTINGMPGNDDGSFFISTSDGYALTSTAPHTLRLTNSDTPCCRCEDMTDLGRYYNEIAQLYHALGAKYAYIKDRHLENLQALEAASQERPVTPLFKVSLAAMGCPYFQLTIDLTVGEVGCWDGAYGVLYLDDGGFGGVCSGEPDWKAERHGYIGTGSFSEDGLHWYATQEVNTFTEQTLEDGTVVTLKKVVERPYAPLTGCLPSGLPAPYGDGVHFTGGTFIPIHWDCKLEAGDVLRIHAVLKSPKMYTERVCHHDPAEHARAKPRKPLADIPVGRYLPTVRARMTTAFPSDAWHATWHGTGLYTVTSPGAVHRYRFWPSPPVDNTTATLDLGCQDQSKLVPDSSEDLLPAMIARVKELQKGKACSCLADPLERCRCEGDDSPECAELEREAALGNYPPPLPPCPTAEEEEV